MKAEKPGAKKDAKPEKRTAVGGTVTGPNRKPVEGAEVFVGYYRTDFTIPLYQATERLCEAGPFRS